MSLTSCTWIGLLEMQVRELQESELVEPRGAVNPSDEVIGVMTEEHKRLYTLWFNMQQRSAEASVRATFARNQVEAEEAAHEMQKCALKADTLRNLLIISVCDYFEAWGKPSIGITGGFKVISSQNPLAQLFGQ